MHFKNSLSKSFRISGSGIQSLLMICFLLFSGCYGPKNRCVYPLTLECRQAKKLWQQSIDNIVKYNFPEDSGRYLSALWEDDFDNAWVTKGNEINITKSFLYKLNHTSKLLMLLSFCNNIDVQYYFLDKHICFNVQLWYKANIVLYGIKIKVYIIFYLKEKNSSRHS